MIQLLKEKQKTKDYSFSRYYIKYLVALKLHYKNRRFIDISTFLRFKNWCLSEGRMRKISCTKAPYYPFQNQL